MTLGSRVLLYVFLGVPVAFGLLFLLALGPVGWFVAGFLVLGGMAVLAVVESGDEEHTPSRNCPDCGAPNGPERETCGYCGTAL